MAWLRLYDDILDDPKIQMLSDRAFRMLINLWCLAKRNDGLIPGDVNSLVFSLRWPRGKILDTLQALISAGLIEKVERGYEPHNWHGRQHESDNAAERMRRYRERQKQQVRDGPLRNGDGQCPVPEQSRTEQNRTEPPKAPPAGGRSRSGSKFPRDGPLSSAEMQARLEAKWAAEEAAKNEQKRSISNGSEADAAGVFPAHDDGESGRGRSA